MRAEAEFALVLPEAPISIVVPADGEPASIAIVVDDLPECEEDEEPGQG
jgi:hypothetical protein